jgi:hypothetical protein
VENSNINKSINLDGWLLSDFKINGTETNYNSTFGDPDSDDYKRFDGITCEVTLRRNGSGIFMKLFLGMYVAFAVSLITFFINASELEAKFALSVGGLFTAIGNKYVIDSQLPKTPVFTLADQLHDITFIFLIIIIILAIIDYTLKRILVKKDLLLFNYLAFIIVLLSYVVINMMVVNS